MTARQPDVPKWMALLMFAPYCIVARVNRHHRIGGADGGGKERKAMGEYVVVRISCGKRAEARKIARALVEERLAACVQVGGGTVESIYRWKGKVETAREIAVEAKTTRGRLGALVRRVEQLHGYETAEILAMNVSGGSRKYLAWVRESCADEEGGDV